jgi:hypothetical protein
MKQVVEMGHYEFDIIPINQVVLFSQVFHWCSLRITNEIMEDFANKYYPENYDFWYDKNESQLRIKSYKVK